MAIPSMADHIPRIGKLDPLISPDFIALLAKQRVVGHLFVFSPFRLCFEAKVWLKQ